MADTETDSKGGKAQAIFGVENFEKSNDQYNAERETA